MKKIICVLVLLVLLTGCGKATKKEDNNGDAGKEQTKIYFKTKNHSFSATLEDNKTAKKLVRKLKDGDITIKMEDSGGYEKKGELRFGLPTEEKNMKAVPGDILLYKDNQLIICYSDFFLNLTKVGKIDNPNDKDYREVMGGKEKDIEFTISLNE